MLTGKAARQLQDADADEFEAIDVIDPQRSWDAKMVSVEVPDPTLLDNPIDYPVVW